MKTSTLALTLALAASFAPASALAQRCSRGRAGAPMPVQVGASSSDFGLTPSACGDLRVALDARGGAVIDTADFYGYLAGEAVLSATVPLTGRVWLSGSLAAPRFRFAQNATLVGTDLGTGGAHLGGHVGLLARDDLHVSAYLRVLLPTEWPTQHGLRTGLEPGVSVLWRPTARWSVMGGFSVPVVFSVLGAHSSALSAARASLDASVLLGTWFEPALGFEARVGNDPSGALEYVAPRLALRFHLGRGVSVHLSGHMPLVGLDRSLFRAALGVSVGW